MLLVKSQQWQKALNLEHVREHLMQVGLMDPRGRILSKREYQRQQDLRRRSPIDNPYRDRLGIRPASDTGFRKIDESHRRSRTPSSRSRSSSPTRLTRRATAVTRRLSPPAPVFPRAKTPDQTKSIPVHERCLVTMIYYGPQYLSDLKRPVVERTGDDIMVTQQHCGGENLVVYRGHLKANDTFQFRSPRHPDYPFALALYVNGLVDHRLSGCCEWRYRSNPRLGGKRALFGILRVEQATPCPRCRTARRSARSMEKKMKKLVVTTPTTDLDSSRQTPQDYDRQSSESHSDRARRNLNIGPQGNIQDLHKRMLSAPVRRPTVDNLSRQSITSITN